MIPTWHSHAMILIVGQHIEVEHSVHINVYKIKVILHWESKCKYQHKIKMWEKMRGKMCITLWSVVEECYVIDGWSGGKKETRRKACYLPDHKAVFSQHM